MQTLKKEEEKKMKKKREEEEEEEEDALMRFTSLPAKRLTATVPIRFIDKGVGTGILGSDTASPWIQERADSSVVSALDL